MKARIRAAAAALAAFALVVPHRAPSADFTPKDGQILGRTMGYVGDGTTGVAVVGIVFSPGHPASEREAETVRAVIGNELPTGRIRLQSRLVPLDQLAGLRGVDALYVTSGLAGSAPAIADAARRLRVPTVSTDMSCVEAALCVVGFSSEPTVQIVIDRGAADLTGVRFTQAFRLLVREK